VVTLEQLFYSLQFGHCRPRLVQHASVADRTVPFAPEPLQEDSHQYIGASAIGRVAKNVVRVHK